MDMGEFLAFRKFFTPVAIQVIFWLGVIGVFISGLAQFLHGFAGFITGLVTIVLGVVFVRIYCELLILLFRIYDELVAMRTGRPPADAGFPVSPAPTYPASGMTTPTPTYPASGVTTPMPPTTPIESPRPAMG